MLGILPAILSLLSAAAHVNTPSANLHQAFWSVSLNIGVSLEDQSWFHTPIQYMCINTFCVGNIGSQVFGLFVRANKLWRGVPEKHDHIKHRVPFSVKQVDWRASRKRRNWQCHKYIDVQGHRVCRTKLVGTVAQMNADTTTRMCYCLPQLERCSRLRELLDNVIPFRVSAWR